MITILFIIFAVASFYCKAKKENMSKFKWAVVGLLISVVPMAGLPVILNNIVGKVLEDWELWPVLHVLYF